VTEQPSPHRIAIQSLFAWVYFLVRHLWVVWVALLLLGVATYFEHDFQKRCEEAGGVPIERRCVTGLKEIHP